MTVTEPSTSLTLRLFGAFQARRDGVPLTGLHLREGERILAFLVLAGGQPVSSLELAKRFYPSEAQTNLPGQGDFPCVRQALSSLRKALGEDAIRLTRTNRATIEFDLSDLDCDVTAFDRLAHIEGEWAEQAWQEAVALYSAPILEGWNEAWVKEHRARRKRSYERTLQRLIQHALQANDRRGAEQWMRNLLVSLPHDEATARDLLRLLAAERRFAEMQEAQERLQEALAATGRTLDPETQTLILEVKRAQSRDSAERLGSDSSAPKATAPATTPAPVPESAAALPLEPAGGAMLPRSPFYVERNADTLFHAALARRDGIVLVKGARQVGKTSLLARGLQAARETGARVVLTDFQKFNEAQLATPNDLCLALATSLALQLELDVSPHAVWNPDYGANLNLEQFVRRRVLKKLETPLVWGLDELDRVFACPFSGEIFGLFRSWHNERSLDPFGPWGHLTLAMAYATEAHLFITDLNQSPFNVGTLLTLEDFTLAQVADLNRRHGEVLSDSDLTRFHDLVGGQPFLVRQGLNALASQPRAFAEFEADALAESGIYGDHLRRMFVALSRSPDLLQVVHDLPASRALPTPEQFFRLRAAGVLSGASSQQARFRCRLYADYLALRIGSRE